MTSGRSSGQLCELCVGYELRGAPGKGEGVFATREFRAGETVIVGVVERRAAVNGAHSTQVGPGEWVLLAGLCTKANHSCDPNCGVRLNRSGAPDLIARRAVRAGDEISFDYAMRNWTIEHFPRRCACGAPGCRGAVTGWKDLPATRKVAYRGLVAPYLLEMDRRAAPSGGPAVGAAVGPRVLTSDADRDLGQVVDE